MCGIAGFFNFLSSAPVGRGALERMARAIAHRGPDQEGYFYDGALGFAHRRLSIIDLTERGRQPMQTPDGRYVICYNGEVYNYLELRAELHREGCAFESNSDTEVVLALFARMGPACLQKLNGMFAMAIWDRMEKRLFLARDRVGIKPLYYTLTRDGLVFASEVKALLAAGEGAVSVDVDSTALATYLRFGYVPGELTLFRGIKKLLPGHLMSVDGTGCRVEEYWDLDYRPNVGRGVEQTATGLRELLLDAVRIHLRSDVPVGVFLSGGLDSSTMVALLAEAGVPDIHTFSVAYRAGSEYDETSFASIVARQFGTDHHVLYVDPAQFRDFIPRYVYHMDEPVTEAAGISLYFIAKALREHVVVALSGEGSDELFGGYEIYRYMRWLEAYRQLPAKLRQGVLTPLLGRIGGRKVADYLALAAEPIEQRYLGVSLNRMNRIDEYLTPEIAAVLQSQAVADVLGPFYAKTVGKDPLSRMLYCDLKAWLVDDLLIKADKMTMANSVELRVPFLDHRVVEYAATIPSSMKIRRGHVKWILKKAMTGRLPNEIVYREKMGFPTPVAQMFRSDLADYLRDTLLSTRCLSRGYLREESLRRIVTEHVNGVHDHHKVLWQLVVLEEWHRVFADGNHAHAA